jgi:hypothetical protein
LVWCRGDFGRAVGNSPRKLRDSAGSWRSDSRESDRRRRVRGHEVAAAPVFLCWQAGRFGFAFDSPRSTESSNSFCSAIWCVGVETSRPSLSVGPGDRFQESPDHGVARGPEELAVVVEPRVVPVRPFTEWPVAAEFDMPLS